jgi:hypothetical protein
MSSAPLVSVIVPAFNVGPLLTDCLRSITTQTYPHLEVIVVDDGSTDRSADVVRGFAARDARVRLIVQENAGVSSARNVGLERASGDYINFVDADDWIEPNTYELMVAALEDGRYDFVTCGYFVDSSDESRPGPANDQFLRPLNTAEGLESVLATQNRFVFTRLFRREVVGPVRFRTDLHWGEDTVFVVEVARRARSSSVLHDRLYHYVQSEGSATRSRINPKRLTGVQMTRVLEDLTRDHPHLVDHVLATRVDIIGIMLEDAYAVRDESSMLAARQLRRTLRTDFVRILTSTRVALQTKVKAALLIASPRAFAWARRVV